MFAFTLNLNTLYSTCTKRVKLQGASKTTALLLQNSISHNPLLCGRGQSAGGKRRSRCSEAARWFFSFVRADVHPPTHGELAGWTIFCPPPPHCPPGPPTQGRTTHTATPYRSANSDPPPLTPPWSRTVLDRSTVVSENHDSGAIQMI